MSRKQSLNSILRSLILSGSRGYLMAVNKIKELAIKIYNQPNNKRVGVGFSELSSYERDLWEQSARQVIRNSKIFHYSIED